jgi:hypothetical protein
MIEGENMLNVFLEPLPDFKTQSGGLDKHPIIYPFLQRIEGYKANLKGHHWHGYNNSTHVRIDEFWSVLGDSQDEIAETGSGVYGIMALGFVGTPSNNWDLMSLVDVIINDYIYTTKQLANEDKNVGLISGLEANIQSLQKIKYFLDLSMCKKD